MYLRLTIFLNYTVDLLFRLKMFWVQDNSHLKGKCLWIQVKVVDLEYKHLTWNSLHLNHQQNFLNSLNRYKVQRYDMMYTLNKRHGRVLFHKRYNLCTVRDSLIQHLHFIKLCKIKHQ